MQFICKYLRIIVNPWPWWLYMVSKYNGCFCKTGHQHYQNRWELSNLTWKLIQQNRKRVKSILWHLHLHLHVWSLLRIEMMMLPRSRVSGLGCANLVPDPAIIQLYNIHPNFGCVSQALKRYTGRVTPHDTSRGGYCLQGVICTHAGGDIYTCRRGYLC